MNVQEILGTYTIIGTNQNDSEDTYKGTLNLTLDKANRIIAHWLINETQPQYGIGFFKNNLLVINFQYQGYEQKIYKGTVVYKCLNKDILEGFWSEEEANPKFLGTENCFRAQKMILN